VIQLLPVMLVEVVRVEKDDVVVEL